MKSSSNKDASPLSDISQRFLFDNTDIRGETVHLNKTFEDIISVHQYAPGVSQLVGEFLAAAVLLSTTLKFEGKLILQARSEGQIPLIMVECTHDLHLRAIARGADQATSNVFSELLANGQLAITVDPLKGQRYQSIVPLCANSLAKCLDAYFEQSEQLATRFWLTADERSAAGMLLQRMPSSGNEDADQRRESWNHACSLGSTLKSEELLTLTTADLLHRLYHDSPVRLFDSAPVAFHCNCSRERTLDALATIKSSELEDILSEQGQILMDCEFCHTQYIYQRKDLEPLLSEKDLGAGTGTMH